MRSFICTALAALVFADKSDFPKEDSDHAHCNLTAQFAGQTCATLTCLIDDEMKIWDSATTSPAGGIYSIKEESFDDYIWTTRQSKDKLYTDD